MLLQIGFAAFGHSVNLGLFVSSSPPFFMHVGHVPPLQLPLTVRCLVGEAGYPRGLVVRRATEAAENERERADNGNGYGVRRLPGRDSRGATGSGASRLQPCLPSPVRRHLACQAINLSGL